MSLIQILNASFGYRQRLVVAGASCAVKRGACLGVYGPNGVGKSTLLRGITGLLRPSAGSVTFNAGIRFGYLPQQRASESHWPMTTLDAACIGISAHRRFGWVSRHKSRVLDQLDEMGVRNLARQPFFQLSGGQQQRVLLAGALAADPQVLLLDEPMSGIDARARDLLLDRLTRAKQDGLAVVLVSHDVTDLLALSDENMILDPAADAGGPSTSRLCPVTDLVARIALRPHSSRPVNLHEAAR